MSPNRTVTCLRSPSSAARPLRIFSARWLGTSGTNASGVRTLVARGFGGECSEDAASGVTSWFPHAPQKRAPAETVALQREHFNSSGVPHCSQNRDAEGLSNLHDGHVIALHCSPLRTYRPKSRNHSGSRPRPVLSFAPGLSEIALFGDKSRRGKCELSSPAVRR
jgi:hypothetical protein